MPALATTLSRAFHDAYDRFPPLVRIKRLAAEAWSMRPRGVDASSRRAHLLAALETEMTYAVLTAWEPGIADQLVSRVIAEAEPQVQKAARIAAQRMADRANAARFEKAAKPATRSGGGGGTGDRKREETIIKTAIRLSKLDTFRINGRPIGDCTPEEAEGWAVSRERDARFVRALISGLPPGQPIRNTLKGDEADTIYEKSERFADQAE